MLQRNVDQVNAMPSTNHTAYMRAVLESRAIASAQVKIRKANVRRAYFLGVRKNMGKLIHRRKTAFDAAVWTKVSPLWFFVLSSIAFAVCLPIIAVIYAEVRLADAAASAERIDAPSLHRAEERKTDFSRPELLTDFDPDQGIALKLSATVPLYFPQPKDFP